MKEQSRQTQTGQSGQTGQIGQLEQVIADQNSAEERTTANTIAKGSAIHHVTDLYLAMCLLSVGVPLREDPPYTATRLKNGKVKWVFNFEGRTADGKESTAELVKHFIESDKYIAEHPNDVYTGALCVVKNLTKVLNIMGRVKPWVAYRSPTGRATMMCIEGSQRQANYVKKGWHRCDPFENRVRSST